MSFYTALTGLNGSSADISATSNNIANVGTTGFKRSRAEFGDIFATSPLQNSSSSIGSGAILNESIKAQDILSSYSINAEVWSATSFNLLRKDGMEVERYNQLNPHKEPKKNHIDNCFGDLDIPVVASTDYMRAYPDQIRPYIKSSFSSLGTDGFGRSDSREELREFFEINAKHIARLSAFTLFKESKISKDVLDKIYKSTNVNPKKPNPWEV